MVLVWEDTVGMHSTCLFLDIGDVGLASLQNKWEIICNFAFIFFFQKNVLVWMVDQAFQQVSVRMLSSQCWVQLQMQMFFLSSMTTLQAKGVFRKSTPPTSSGWWHLSKTGEGGRWEGRGREGGGAGAWEEEITSFFAQPNINCQ